ncbi:MAG: ABC transporter permease [Ignavibacteria bacterium]|nr:ABC transporter permease [Ignavibacteria bacterium]
MFNRRTLAIIKRELKTKLLNKSFIIMTVLVPLFMFGLIGVQVFIHVVSEDESPNLLVVSETENISKKLKNEFDEYAEVKLGNYKISYETIDSSAFAQRLNNLRDDLLNERLTGIVYVPGKALVNKNVRYYSSNPSNRALFDKIRPGINKALINIYFEDKQLSREDVEFARDNVEITGFRVTKDEKVEEEGYGNMVALFLFTFLLYMALIFSGQSTMLSVVEEKSSRIVEVLLSSASSTELMAGKVIGIVITEVIQMAIWLLPVVMLITTSWFMLPAEFMLQLDLSYILYFLINFTIALFTFVGLFATVGAIFDNPQDAQSGVWPLMILVIIPFLIAMSLQSNPQSNVAKITSLLPFTSLMVMPARFALVDVPVWELALSFAINLAVLFAIFPLAGKIYRVGILVTGKKPKWSEVRKWLKG